MVTCELSNVGLEAVIQALEGQLLLFQEQLQEYSDDAEAQRSIKAGMAHLHQELLHYEKMFADRTGRER